MDDKKPNKVDLDNYYPTVDKNILENLCSNTNIKNLIYLSSQMDLNPFNKKNKKWQLKNKDKFIKECEQVKKKELKDFSATLTNLAKLGSNNTIEVKNIYKNFEYKLDNLDKIITCANNIETVDFPIEKKEKKDKSKTTYIVDHEPYSQSNVVSFDIIGGKQELVSGEKTKTSKPHKLTNQTNQTNPVKNKEKIVEIKAINNVNTPSETSENGDYLECYGNC